MTSTMPAHHRRLGVGLLVVAALVLSGLLAVTSLRSGAADNTQTAVNNAVAYGHGRGERVAVATFDRSTGRTVYAGDAGSYYATASLVKLFIASRLLESGQMTGSVEQTAYKMITQSDDASANALYGRVGGDDLYQWVSARFHIPIQPPADPGTWGETRITALGLISFYRQVLTSSAIHGWLLNAMAHYTCPASDGWPQCMGLPSVTRAVKVKQGWMCCLQNLTRMHTTGFVDSDRAIVVILTEGSTGIYGSYGRDTLTGMAQRVIPGGQLPIPVATMTQAPVPPAPMTPGPSEGQQAPARRTVTTPSGPSPSTSVPPSSVPSSPVPPTRPTVTSRTASPPPTTGGLRPASSVPTSAAPGSSAPSSSGP